jgi:outer membrane protein TolC
VAATIVPHLSAAAQEAAPQRTITLGQVYTEATRANPRNAAALAIADAAAARVPAAKLPPDPQLQIAFMNYDLPGLQPMELLGMRQLQVMQMIPIGKLGLSGRKAAALAEAQRERAADVSWDTRARVAMAFYEIYRIDRSLAVERETIRLLLDVAAVAEAMYRVGEGRQADILRAHVEIGRMAADTLRMQTMRAAMSARLNALLNRSMAAEVATPALPAFPSSIPSVDALQLPAMQQRPMIRAGEEEVAAATAATALARREIVPDFQFGFQYAQRSSAMGGGTEHMGSLMIGASIPIFASRRQYRMRDEMLAMQSMAETDLAAMRIETGARIVEMHADLTTARTLASLYRKEVLPQAEANVQSALAAYRAGSVDFMTLLDARMSLNRYREELLSFVATEGRTWAELEMLVGQELLDPNVPAPRGPAEGDTQ